MVPLLRTNNLWHQASITMTVLAVTLQKETNLVPVSYWADKRQDTLTFPRMCTFTLLLFFLQTAWEPGGVPASLSLPDFPICFHDPPSPAPPPDWCTIVKDAERKINIFYIDSLILSRFMNFASVVQKLAFLTMRGGKSLIVFLLPQELQRHLVLCRHLHFTLNAKYVWKEQIFVLIRYIC